MTLLRKSVSLDFLKTIACEPVLYETDSEAADSWANGEDNTVNSRSRPCLPSSSGVAPTSDPARIAFRNIMNKLPHKSILQRNNQPRSESPVDPRSPRPESVSPTFSDIMEERDIASDVIKERDVSKIVSIDDDGLDEVVENEIQLYLERTLGRQKKQSGKQNKKLRKGRQSGKLIRKVGKREHQRHRGKREPQRSEQKQRRKLDQKVANRNREQNRGKLDRTLDADTKVRGVLRSQRRDSSSRDSNKQRSVTFDDSSSSSSSTTFSARMTGTPTSSSASLASLRRKTGSQTSAFSAYAGINQSRIKHKQEEKTMKEGWTSFKKGSNFFSTTSF